MHTAVQTFVGQAGAARAADSAVHHVCVWELRLHVYESEP